MQVEDILKKITGYQIINFLLSGSVLVILLSVTTPLELMNDNSVATIFIFYFVGLTASRIGSLLLEPLLKKARVINFEPYHDYLKASKADPKIDILSQESNTYRTLVTALIIYLFIFTISKAASSLFVGKADTVLFITALALILLFVASYRKQTIYLSDRIRSHKNK